VFHHILVVDLVDVEDRLRGGFLLDPEVDIVPVVSSLPELLVGDDIGVETRNISDVLELKELFACRCVDIDLDAAIAFHVGTAVSGEDRIDPVVLLVGGGVESVEVIADMNGRAAV
jgi:hypothetical protein